MNTTVLEGIEVLQGKYFANRALRTILGNMIPDYKLGPIKLPKYIVLPIPNKDAKSFKQARTVHDLHIDALKLRNDMFNAIVANGKVKALQFIEDNKKWLEPSWKNFVAKAGQNATTYPPKVWESFLNKDIADKED